MGLSPTRRKRRVLFITLLCLFAFFAYTQYYVWIPDIYSNSPHLVGSVTSKNGDSLAIIQEWNHGDFYSTFLDHRRANGKITRFVLDGDDIKRWRCSFKTIGADQVQITFWGEDRIEKFDFKSDVIVRHDGATFNGEDLSQYTSSPSTFLQQN